MMETSTLWSLASTGSKFKWKQTVVSLFCITYITCLSPRSLVLHVDEEHKKAISLLPGRFSQLSPAIFFIGGLPPGEESRLPIKVREVSRRFRGCIQHLVVGGA